ncbi:protein SULFUR DEFICIENCY-INDUCED 1-like isoform X2 [Andrographis paniculata]|uniref:protein SULFUR DEFICIENCY-INDUCED 1-like isoform X2 n=1 Tax=Andrographis paniculata TaxID=175694 RepID=UPI0021E944B5|nr:protein SULFUR DEFICIENCY-INDUCED 1-like isoform X2 [Andrographis paniculata]
MECSGRSKKDSSSSPEKKDQKDLFHVINKVPSGDGPYVRAKRAQVVEKDPETAVVWFWKAINAGDRVDSALKDMAVVLKQLNRPEQAIEAIKSFRSLCPKNSQPSLDNVLIDLYKKCGKIDEQIALLKHKLRLIYIGEAFHGRPTRTARSHGKKFQVSVRQETSRLLKSDFMTAEVVYRKAQMIDPDANKALNLCHCLMEQERWQEAGAVLQEVVQHKVAGSDDAKARKRAVELSLELDSRHPAGDCPLALDIIPGLLFDVEDALMEELDAIINERAPTRSRRLPIFEQISQFRDQLAC